MSDEITDAIAENATNPAEVSVDDQRVKAHSLRDQIAADRYLKTTAAQAHPKRGLRFIKLVPPGAV